LGYDRTAESDILLLDISNSSEYIWTNDFILPTRPVNKLIIIGAVCAAVGSVSVSVLGCFLLYTPTCQKYPGSSKI
jgi:hypothetical protein